MIARSRFCWLVIGATVAILACSDGMTDPAGINRTRYPLLSAAIVSDAHARSAAGSTAAGGAEPISWISLPPGALVDVIAVQIRSASGLDLTAPVPLVDGGFDPVAVQASAGDELVLVQNLVNGGVRLSSVVVPPRRPPVIVRTSPPDGRIDVALNVRPAVIFSEPIDKLSLDATAVLLQVEGQFVPGALEVPELQPWLVEFVPSDPLAPGTTYDLVVGQGVRDLEGDALEVEFVARFTTAGAPTDMDFAFVSNRSGEPWIYLANRAGTAVRRLTPGERPRWSADGSKIVFQGALGGVFTINADGSNLRSLGNGRNPAWSPDGGSIVFTDGWKGPVGGGLYVMNANGTGTRLLIPHDFADVNPDSYYDGLIQNPAWSPDGSRIAFERAAYGEPWQIWVMNADGSNPYKLSRDGWDNSQPAWSPDGMRIAARRVIGGIQVGEPAGDAIVDYDADGSGLFRVHARPIFPYAPRPFLEYPDWSPDGFEILFDQPIRQGVTGILLSTSLRVFAVALETGVLRQVIPDVVDPVFSDYADYQPAWSPASR